MRRATPRIRWIVLTTVLVWIVTMSVTWGLTRGDYYRTFPSYWWFWAFAVAVCWTVAAYSSVDTHIDSPRLDKVSLQSLQLSRQEPLSVPTDRSPTVDDVDSRRHAVLGAYGAFLSDIVAIVGAPLLADPTCPTTDRFRECLVVAEDAHSAAVRDPARLPAYSQAVRELEKAWQQALSHAKRKGSSTFDPTEQDALRRARGLLDIALDETAFAAERRSAMHKAVALLRTVIDIPEQAGAAIEHRVKRLEIEG
jgi:hypothetical protein